MRIQTIHHNPMGDVLNECSAKGFRITTENGEVYDINTEGGMVTIQTRGCIVNLEAIPELLRMLDNKKPAPSGALVRTEGFDEWYDSVDVRFWDNYDACNAAFHAGKRATLAQQPAVIPRLANCGRYTATDNTGQHYYLNHANTWQAFQGQQPAAVDGAAVDRVAAALLEEATDEPWTVAGVEHEGPDRDYYRKLARKVLALAQQPAAVGSAVDGGTKTCYQCNRPVTWLAPDSRCGDCTRLTPDEVGG